MRDVNKLERCCLARPIAVSLRSCTISVPFCPVARSSKNVLGNEYKSIECNELQNPGPVVKTQLKAKSWHYELRDKCETQKTQD